MAIILAAKSGIWTDTATWIGGIVPGPGDVAVANSYTIGGPGLGFTFIAAEFRNDTTGGATAGGRLALAANCTLIANVYAGGTANTNGCVSASTVGPSAIIGDVYAGTGCIGARNNGAQIFTIVGTVYGNDYGPGSTGITAGIYGAVNASTGTLRVLRTVSGARGMPAISGPCQFVDAPHAQAIVRATGSLTAVTLRDLAGWEPDPSDVLIGTGYEGRTGIMVPVPQRQGMTAMAMSGSELSLEMLTDDLGDFLTTDEGAELIGI